MLRRQNKPIFKFGAIARLLAVCCSVCLWGCGGSSSGSSSSFPITIKVSPATTAVVTGASLPFSAVVNGTINSDVTWSVTSGGVISPNGMFTAGAAASTVTVTATSVADPSKAASAVVTVMPLSPYTGTFGNISSMKFARSNHTATLLPSGKVLFAGGLDAGGAALANAEFYRPAFNNFTTAASMKTPRAYHTATLLINGKVLVTGGIDSNNVPQNSVELLDPATGTWTAAGSMSEARWLHSAILLHDGKVLITGGNSADGPGIGGGIPLRTAEIYDPKTGTFTAAGGTLTDARYYQTATLLNDGSVLHAGGYGVGGVKLASAELYDPLNRTFTATGSMTVGRWLHSAVRFVKNVLGIDKEMVMVAGGDLGTVRGSTNYLRSTELYDPETKTFTTTTDMDTPRGHHAASLLADGKVLISAGFGGYSTASHLGTTELYDPAGAFIGSSALPAGLERANHTSTLLPSGMVLIAGGNNSGPILKSAFLYR